MLTQSNHHPENQQILDEIYNINIDKIRRNHQYPHPLFFDIAYDLIASEQPFLETRKSLLQFYFKLIFQDNFLLTIKDVKLIETIIEDFLNKIRELSNQHDTTNYIQALEDHLIIIFDEAIEREKIIYHKQRNLDRIIERLSERIVSVIIFIKSQLRWQQLENERRDQLKEYLDEIQFMMRDFPKKTKFRYDRKNRKTFTQAQGINITKLYK
ncbi:hypothetical protein [Gloeothece verrucosa]|uniref:Uncharacterized protein n=1 Tax=Gloeothece verrucosa (strain PCC 7822) TaxID=497965 RepID=E0U678_GLOV7|nr:hypothetical protein [Gloeothece verrucosa]ADN12414.1 hypothetical protein Cyan7822_0368 [Gloeothece verrucosa PCC 7822]